MRRFACAAWVLGASPVYERVTSIRLKIPPSVLPSRRPRSVPNLVRHTTGVTAGSASAGDLSKLSYKWWQVLHQRLLTRFQHVTEARGVIDVHSGCGPQKERCRESAD